MLRRAITTPTVIGLLTASSLLATVSPAAGQSEAASLPHERDGNVAPSADRSEPTGGEPRRAPPARGAQALQSGMGLTGLMAVLMAGGAHAASVVGIVRVNQVSNALAFEAYRTHFPNEVDVCEEARRGTEPPGSPPAATIASLCASADRNQTLTIVGAVLGHALGALGTTLIVVAATSPADEPGAALLPVVQVDDDGAFAAVRLSW